MTGFFGPCKKARPFATAIFDLVVHGNGVECPALFHKNTN